MERAWNKAGVFRTVTHCPEICHYGITPGYQGIEDSLLSKADLNKYRLVRLSPHLYGRMTIDEKHIEIFMFQNIEKAGGYFICFIRIVG